MICLNDAHSDQFTTVGSDSRPLANNLTGPDEVVEDLLVDGGESSGSGSFLLVGGTGVSLGFGEDSSLGKEDDVFVGQLLLELSGESARRKRGQDQ